MTLIGIAYIGYVPDIAIYAYKLASICYKLAILPPRQAFGGRGRRGPSGSIRPPIRPDWTDGGGRFGDVRQQQRVPRAVARGGAAAQRCRRMELDSSATPTSAPSSASQPAPWRTLSEADLEPLDSRMTSPVWKSGFFR